MADLNSLKQDAGTIRDASQSQENTAFRVGSWLVSLIEFLTDTTIEAVITNITPSVNADGIVLTLDQQKADGSTFAKSITMPIADATKAGLMSPDMVDKLATLRSNVNQIVAKNNEQDATIVDLNDALSKLRNDVNAAIQKNSNQDTGFYQLQQLVEDAKNATESNGADIGILKDKINNISPRVGTLEEKEMFQRETNTTLLNRTGDLDIRLAQIEAIDLQTMQSRLNEQADEMQALVQRLIALENK